MVRQRKIKRTTIDKNRTDRRRGWAWRFSRGGQIALAAGMIYYVFLSVALLRRTLRIARETPALDGAVLGRAAAWAWQEMWTWLVRLSEPTTMTAIALMTLTVGSTVYGIGKRAVKEATRLPRPLTRTAVEVVIGLGKKLRISVTVVDVLIALLCLAVVANLVSEQSPFIAILLALAVWVLWTQSERLASLDGFDREAIRQARNVQARAASRRIANVNSRIDAPKRWTVLLVLGVSTSSAWVAVLAGFSVRHDVGQSLFVAIAIGALQTVFAWYSADSVAWSWVPTSSALRHFDVLILAIWASSLLYGSAEALVVHDWFSFFAFIGINVFTILSCVAIGAGARGHGPLKWLTGWAARKAEKRLGRYTAVELSVLDSARDMARPPVRITWNGRNQQYETTIRPGVINEDGVVVATRDATSIRIEFPGSFVSIADGPTESRVLSLEPGCVSALVFRPKSSESSPAARRGNSVRRFSY